jgi:GrpB-like predicted nucleotidyltransferase (UPF0157 family)
VDYSLTALIADFRRNAALVRSVQMLGLKHGVNVLVDYDPAWATAFEAEKIRILSAVRDVALGVEHYGSTAVIGLRAKPIVDILLGVTPLENWIKCKRPLESLGYDYAENAGVPGHDLVTSHLRGVPARQPRQS